MAAFLENNRMMAKPTQTARLHWISTGVLFIAIPTVMAVAQTPDRASPLPPGQVWQCVHDGHKIFSDAPCGSGATVRQLNDVNVMDPAPATRVGGYPPGVAMPGVAAAAYPAPYREDEPPAGIAEGTNAGEAPDGVLVYGTQAVGIANQWQRVRHAPRPLHRARPSARAHAAHAAGR